MENYTTGGTLAGDIGNNEGPETIVDRGEINRKIAQLSNTFGSGPCEPIKYTEEMKKMIMEAKPAPATACEIFMKALIVRLKPMLLSDEHYTYNQRSDWFDIEEHSITWYDSNNARNLVSCWDIDGDGVWSKVKSENGITLFSDEFEFNVLTDNHEDIINRILGGK